MPPYIVYAHMSKHGDTSYHPIPGIFPLYQCKWAPIQTFLCKENGNTKRPLPPKEKKVYPTLNWFALHLKFESVIFNNEQIISGHNVDQLQI